MWNLVWLVLDDPTKLDALLDSWEAAGVRGATILESSGLARRRGYLLQDDTPLFPSLSSLIQGEMTHNLTLFALIDQSLPVEQVLRATEQVIGDLNHPQTGVFFAMPLSFVKGVRASDER